MQYDTGKHCVFYHRYHVVWSTKYRYKVLTGDLRLRVRDICRQVCRENEVDILRGVLSSDHVHMFVSVPPKLAISDLVRKMKGRSSYRVQREFPAIRKRYWGCRLWGRVFASSLEPVAFTGSLFNHQRCHHERRRTSVLGKAYR